jgi:hypothetical protein
MGDSQEWGPGTTGELKLRILEDCTTVTQQKRFLDSRNRPVVKWDQ